MLFLDLREVFFGFPLIDKNFNEFREHQLIKKNMKYKPNNVVRVVGSHKLNKETEEYLEQFPDYSFKGMHSALKFCLLLEGKADIFVRIRASYEWDNCAGQALMTSFGGRVINPDTKLSLLYNKENLVCPSFLGQVDV